MKKRMNIEKRVASPNSCGKRGRKMGMWTALVLTGFLAAIPTEGLRVKAESEETSQEEQTTEAVDITETASGEMLSEEESVKNDGETEEEMIDNNSVTDSIYMIPEDAWVGDVMPFTDEDGLHLFYLYDTDNNGVGYHPFYCLSTTDLVGYTDDGEAIPYANNTEDADLALGTGSVLYVDGVYHCFYTGHNDLNPDRGLDKECVMHAISEDRVNWEKIPEDTIYAPDEYSGDDFRDPEVFWCEEESCYWMLVSTMDTTGTALIAKYTSDDLTNWVLGEPIQVENTHGMYECTNIIEWDGTYYLFYSWDCVTYYAVSDNINGPYAEPENSVLSSSGFSFYAAKTALYNEAYYLCGWIGRKSDESDTGTFSWAGNLCIYQLVQNSDGTLGVKQLDTFSDYFTEDVQIQVADSIGAVSVSEGEYTLTGTDEEVAALSFGTLPTAMIAECEVTFSEDCVGGMGFVFGSTGDLEKALGIYLDVKKQALHFDGCIISRQRYSDPVITTDYAFTAGETYHVVLVVEKEIISIYINSEKALSTRIYRAPGNEWGLYSVQGTAVVTGLQVAVPES